MLQHSYTRRNRVLQVLLMMAAHFLAPAGVTQTRSLLFDFGGADAQTALPPVFWNNITAETGAGSFENIPLINTEGDSVSVQIRIELFFDATPDSTGTTGSPIHPGSASSDSLVQSFGTASLAIIGSAGSSDTYSLTFYSSAASALDNRETQYTVSGVSTETVALNPSGNENTSVQVFAMGLDVFGEIYVELSPGPNHSDANSTVYLGILQIKSSAGWTALIDFGNPSSTTSVVAEGESIQWNNLTGTVGQTDDGIFEGVVSTKGQSSDLYIQMLSRFNGVNTNGTTDSEVYPDSATSDSLYGNIEVWNGLVDVFPSFLIAGLDTSKTYDIAFYASRTATDNRETKYTVAGAKITDVFLDVAGNITGSATAVGIKPDANGGIQVDLTPGPNNNNGNHFIYLGILRIESPDDGFTYLFDFGGDNATQLDVETPPESWNNVVESVGLANDGSMNDLFNTEFTRTNMGLEMVARFNGVNRAGSGESSVFPASATGDSLYGNTELFEGAENVFPAFKVTGLNRDNAYDFTFYGSRGASDNRETRYAVTGSNSGFGDLNAAENIDGTVSVRNIRPNAESEIVIEITPGPNNDNGNHFTYLGAMRMDWQPSFKPQVLVDAGGTDFPTTVDPAGNVWNNFQSAIGQTNDGSLGGLVAVNGAATGFGIRMLSRFNGVNSSGTTDAAPYPTTATRDSLFGNTEVWSELENIFPSFMLTGLDPTIEYDLTFYASRTATDNREAQYTVTGAGESVVFLNIAGNVDDKAVASGIMPSADGTITVRIEPGPNNDNGNHFTYLGVLQLDWTGGPPESENVSITGVLLSSGMLEITVTGKAGQTYTLHSTTDFKQWANAQTITLDADSGVIQVPADQSVRFFRVMR